VLLVAFEWIEMVKSRYIKRFSWLGLLIFILIFIFNYQYIEAKIGNQLILAGEGIIFALRGINLGQSKADSSISQKPHN